MLAVVTEATREAQEMLRDPSTFQWATITLFLLTFYVYAVEIEARRWHVVLAGLAFWLWDWFNEISNSVILHLTGESALWTINRQTSYLILIGLCIEIAFMFLILPVAYVKLLPKDRDLKILGVNNRWWYIVGCSMLAVAIEVVLNQLGALEWHYGFWNWPFVPLIVIFGYLPFFWIATVIYDLGDNRRKQLRIIGAQLAVVTTMLVVFGPVLNWI
jgi:hypothetical protein